MRLIDADALNVPHFHLATDRIKVLDMIDEAPTIDAVSVVRCKECKWYKQSEAFSEKVQLKDEPQTESCKDCFNCQHYKDNDDFENCQGDAVKCIEYLPQTERSE